MSLRQVAFPCGDLILAGELVVPTGKTDWPAVAVCHPHPLYGGDMHNHVVAMVCRSLEETGIASLRFNFRGVGLSAGSHGQGVGEQDDLRAALSFLESIGEVAGNRIGAAGYSFGARVTVNTASADDRIRAFAAISLPTSMGGLATVDNYVRPKLFISGSHDQFGPADELQKLVESLPEPKRFLVIRGADHFWFHGVEQAATEVATFFSEVL